MWVTPQLGHRPIIPRANAAPMLGSGQFGSLGARSGSQRVTVSSKASAS